MTNALAYLSRSPVMKQKRFISLTPGQKSPRQLNMKYILVITTVFFLIFINLLNIKEMLSKDVHLASKQGPGANVIKLFTAVV
jgi:hypothetical protein